MNTWFSIAVWTFFPSAYLLLLLARGIFWRNVSWGLHFASGIAAIFIAAGIIAWVFTIGGPVIIPILALSWIAVAVFDFYLAIFVATKN